MKSEKVTLYNVNLFLGDNGAKVSIKEYKMVFSGTNYGGNGRRVDKAKLMRIDSDYYRSHKTFDYFTWCLEADIDKAIKMLTQHLIAEMEAIKKEFEKKYILLDTVYEPKVNFIGPKIKQVNENVIQSAKGEYHQCEALTGTGMIALLAAATFGGDRCPYNGKYFERGKWWCKKHLPSHRS